MDRKWRIEQIGAPNASSAALATLYRINWPNSWSVGRCCDARRNVEASRGGERKLESVRPR